MSYAWASKLSAELAVAAAAAVRAHVNAETSFVVRSVSLKSLSQVSVNLAKLRWKGSPIFA